MKQLFIPVALFMTSLPASAIYPVIAHKSLTELSQTMPPALGAKSTKKSESPIEPEGTSCLDKCDNELEVCKTQGKSILVCSTKHQKCVLQCDDE